MEEVSRTESKSAKETKSVRRSTLPLGPDYEILHHEFEINTYQDLIEHLSLDYQLFSLGYLLICRVNCVTKEERNNKFMVALNPKGQQVYIIVDVVGYSSSNVEEILVKESKEFDIDTELKQLITSKLDSATYGVLVKSCKSICILSLYETENQSFDIIEEKNIEDSEDVVLFPVVKFSEIKQNPKEVLYNTDLMTKRLRNSEYRTQLKHLSSLQESIKDLNMTFGNFNQVREQIESVLKSNSQKSEEMIKPYLDKIPTDLEVEKFRTVYNNSVKHNLKIIEFLKLIKKVSKKKKDIETITKEFNKVLNELNEFLRSINTN